MPAINRIQLERDNDTGVHEVRSGERLEPAEPEPPGTQPAPNREPPADERPQKRDEKRDEKRDAPGRETPPRRAQSRDQPLRPVPVEDEAVERHDKDEFERATTHFPGG